MAMFSSFSSGPGDGDDPKDREKQLAAMREMFSPAQVEQVMNQAVTFCWMMMPPEKKNVPAVVVELRRIFERTIKNLEEDAQAFGIG